MIDAGPLASQTRRARTRDDSPDDVSQASSLAPAPSVLFAISTRVSRRISTPFLSATRISIVSNTRRSSWKVSSKFPGSTCASIDWESGPIHQNQSPNFGWKSRRIAAAVGPSDSTELTVGTNVLSPILNPGAARFSSTTILVSGRSCLSHVA